MKRGEDENYGQNFSSPPAWMLLSRRCLWHAMDDATATRDAM